MGDSETGSVGKKERSPNGDSLDVALQKSVMDLAAQIQQQQRDIDRCLQAVSSLDARQHQSNVEPDLEVASEDDYEEAINSVNLACVVVYKVATANTLVTRLFAALWVLVLLSFTLVAVFSLISICIGVSWPRCHSQQDCPLGTACVFVPGGDETWLEPTCEDCSILSTNNFPRVLEKVPFGGKGFSTENASQLCANALVEAAPALGNVDFDTCLHVGAKVAAMSFQDVIALYIVFLITAGLMTKDAMEHSRARQLRELILPLDPVALHCESCGKLCAVLVVKFAELLLRNIVVPLVIVCLNMLILTQGTNSASLLLNGLSVGFFMEIDDLIPSMVLRDAEINRVGDYLKRAAQKAILTDMQFQGKSQIGPIVRVALAAWYFVTFVWAFAAATKHPCEHLLHHYYYRVGLVLGLWIPGVAQSVISFLGAAYEVSSTSAGQSVTRAVRAKIWLGVVSRLASELLEMCLSAWLMTLTFWFSVTIIYYAQDWEPAFKLFGQMANDIFGTCVKGFGDKCTEW